MSDLPSQVVSLLRADLAAEAAAGFLRLRRTPYTEIIWLLDYFAGLAPAEREALLDALANSAALAFFPRPGPAGPAGEPALARCREAKDRPGSRGGTRYTGVRMLCQDPSFREPGGYHETWRANFTPLHFQPRADLLPGLGHLKAARAPLLRKLVDAALGRLFAPRKEKQAGGACKYVGA